MPVGVVLRQRLGDREIEAFVTGVRPLDELRRLLSSVPSAEEDPEPGPTG